VAAPAAARGRRLALAGAVALLALLAVLAGTTRALLQSDAGTRWLLARTPQVEAAGFSGALLGENWRAERLRWSNGTQSVTVEGLAAEGLRWTWRPHGQAWLGLEIRQLRARKLTVISGPSGTQPLQPPASLALPLQLALADGRVETLQIDSMSPITAVSVRGLVLDARTGGEHRVEQAGLDWQDLRLTAQGQIGTAAPMPLRAEARVTAARESAASPWAAMVQLRGELARVQLGATLRGEARAGAAAPALDLQAALRPFEAWPLGAVKLHTEALDLAALSLKAPQTQLSGSAEIASSAADAPLTATLALDNALPGRWNEGRLPLRRLSADLHGRVNEPGRIELRHFEADFGPPSRPAGRWTGSALWLGHELSLQTVLEALAPQRIDGRAAAMQLSGPVTATLRGLPSPDPAARTTPPAPHIDWQFDLAGRLDAAPQPVQLASEGSADEQRIELQSLRASSGKASASLQALLERTARGPWQLQTAGRLSDFDPLPWWPGEPGSDWRKGPHRLSADWQFDLHLPADATRLAPIALAQRLTGSGKLEIHESVLAGVPLAGVLTLGTTPKLPATAALAAELHLGGNQLRVEASGNPNGAGDGDRWRAEVQADALAALAPLARLYPPLAAWAPRQGSASGVVSAAGRWPKVHTEGHAQVQQLQAGTLTLSRGQASWRLDSGGGGAQAFELELFDAELGARRADHLRADLRGTLADHHIDITGTTPLVPPTQAVQLLDLPAQAGTQARLQAQGAWIADPAGGGRWSAQLEHLVVNARDGEHDTAAPAAGWFEAHDLRAELGFAPDGELVSLRADPGQAQIAGAIELRWDEMRLDLRGTQPGIELHASIEPFTLAPLLARLQPTMGWQGDLRLAARVDIRAGERFDADLAFERRDGDLHVTGGEGSQWLGLSEARLTLAAHDGVWLLTPVFKGRNLGDITGSARVQTMPDLRWPHAEAPLAGSLQARVADIGIWGAWLPPGWRLTGEVRTDAVLAGHFGDPRYTGSVAGTGLGVRNLLQGVNVSEGQIAVRLEGDKAQIERFSLRGGEGTIAVTGGASLGNAPQARLQMKADHFRVLGRVDRTIIASGQAELSLQSEQGRLDGSFTIDEGIYDTSRSDAPSLDEDVTVRRPGAAPAAAEEAAPPRPRRNFVLGVEVDLGEKLRLRGHGLDTSLRGRLKLETPGGRLAVNGAITAANGTYVAYGQKLEIERGIVTFNGALDNPRLDILALRPNIDQRVGVAITGNLQTPRVRLYSDPELSDTDKLSWLVLGRAPDGLGRGDAALLQRAAVALLAGEGEAPTDALMRRLGIDDLSLHQTNTDVRETVVSLGKQLSRRWYLGYERGVNATTGTWQLVYRIAQRFTLRAQSGLESALDVIWIWRAQETPPDAGMRKSSAVPP
jgi:translocation and assembly module TamB